MSINLIKNNFIQAYNLLFEFYSKQSNITKIKNAGDIMVATLRNNNKIIACGNGGSMTDAMHFAEEFTGRFREKRKPFAAIAISDPAHLSCVANDYGFEYVFSKFIEANGNKNDVLLAISTSGNSINILNAVEIAAAKHMKVIALTGKDGGKLATLSDVEICVPWYEYADRIQEIHIKIIHSLIHYVEEMMNKQ